MRGSRSPPFGTANAVGTKLLAARHENIRCKTDLAKIKLTHGELWLGGAVCCQFPKLSEEVAHNFSLPSCAICSIGC